MREKARGRWLSEEPVVQFCSPHVPIADSCLVYLHPTLPCRALPRHRLPQSRPASGPTPREQPRKQRCSNQGQDVQRTQMKMKPPQPIIDSIMDCKLQHTDVKMTANSRNYRKFNSSNICITISLWLFSGLNGKRISKNVSTYGNITYWYSLTIECTNKHIQAVKKALKQKHWY